jgi:hypothetical protein
VGIKGTLFLLTFFLLATPAFSALSASCQNVSTEIYNQSHRCVVHSDSEVSANLSLSVASVIFRAETELVAENVTYPSCQDANCTTITNSTQTSWHESETLAETDPSQKNRCVREDVQSNSQEEQAPE